ncbi:YidB family protein [Citrobacter braakii]|uniref:YidB family protein n=1 Tax=Enterobacteriaceae TaxID=543 RepID=UPI0018673C2F|nr:YidB family protein [Enterobacter hormaechei]
MDILNNMMGKILTITNGRSGLITFLDWAENEGVLPALLLRFRELQDKGLTAESFTPEHISHLFRDGELPSLAQHMGLSSEDVSAWISAHLPALLQHLSAGAAQQDGSNLLDMAWSFLRERMK